MTRSQHKAITADEMLRMSDLGPCELVAGQIVKGRFSGLQHGEAAVRVACLVGNHAEPGRLGFVVGGRTGFLLSTDPDTVRTADVAFVRVDRVAKPPRGYFPGAPDLAVEVVSPDDRAGEVHDKARMWLEAGARLVWVVWPETKTVTVHRPRGEPQTLREGDSLTGEDVLLGFQCDVSAAFR